MPNPLNLFPARVPIGRATMPDGQTVDVLPSAEFSRALADLFVRVGGTSAPTIGDLLALASLGGDDNSAALLAEIADLRYQLAQLAPALALRSQLEALRIQIAMMEDPAALVRYILGNYAPLRSPHFRGIPTAPTAELNTNTDQLATCKFVLGQASNQVPLENSTPRPGTDLRYSRADHVHPHDTTKQDSIAPATVTGSRGGNAALASLLAGLAGQGLIINNTTA